jgi:hypothetical protein
MKLYDTLERFYLSKFYVLIPSAIIILACTGSFVAYYLTKSGLGTLNFIQLTLSVAAAMAYLAAVLSQMPRKVTFSFFVYGMLIELILLVINVTFKSKKGGAILVHKPYLCFVNEADLDERPTV